MRLTKETYFLLLAQAAALRATCTRRKVGCVLVSPAGHIVATGYNGSLPGAPHCDEAECLMHDGHCVRTIHAEVNAIAQASRNGVSTEGTTAYVTCEPCLACLKALLAAGVQAVRFVEGYPSEARDVFLADLAASSGDVLDYEGRETPSLSIVGEEVVSERCYVCGGRGEVMEENRYLGSARWKQQTCPKCGGSGVNVTERRTWGIEPPRD
jgi:dCMP deaminase